MNKVYLYRATLNKSETASGEKAKCTSVLLSNKANGKKVGCANNKVFVLTLKKKKKRFRGKKQNRTFTEHQ